MNCNCQRIVCIEKVITICHYESNKYSLRMYQKRSKCTYYLTYWYIWQAIILALTFRCIGLIITWLVLSLICKYQVAILDKLRLHTVIHSHTYLITKMNGNSDLNDFIFVNWNEHDIHSILYRLQFWYVYLNSRMKTSLNFSF